MLYREEYKYQAMLFRNTAHEGLFTVCVTEGLAPEWLRRQATGGFVVKPPEAAWLPCRTGWWSLASRARR